nr:hypothetical protein [Clostridioides difficile]
MKFKKQISSIVVSTMLVLGSMNLSYADGTNVVTLGANLSESQKQQMLNYFGVKKEPSLSFRCNKCRRKTVFTRCCNRGSTWKSYYLLLIR